MRRLRFEALELRNLLAVLPGDYNFNGIVQANDYTIWKANYGNFGLGISGDGNSDGIVDAVDYTVWRNNLGKTFADVPPDPPKTITVKAAGATTIQITWEAAAFATGYTVQRRLPEMTATFTTIATNVVGTSFSDSAVVDGAIHEYQVIAQNNGGESEPSQRTSARANRANLTAFRAQHFHDPNIPSTAPVYAPFAKHGVAEIDEESTTLGPGIRINTDDDNMNGVPDVVDVNIDQENDLIEIRVDRLPGQGNLILEIGTRTALYYTFDKSVFVPFQTGSRTELCQRLCDCLRRVGREPWGGPAAFARCRYVRHS